MKATHVRLLALCALLCSGLTVRAEDRDPVPTEPKTNETNNVRCRLPMKVGLCRAAFPRYFYNVTSESCSRFIYGGCGNNENNFPSEAACNLTCSGVSGSVLPDESTAAPPARAGPIKDDSTAVHQERGMTAGEYAEHCEVATEVGPCRAAFRRWYFNKVTGSCEGFIYGGCRGNKNNYMSKESCIATCAVTVLPSSRKGSDDDGDSADYKDHCVATPDAGPCRAAFPMYYYDPNSETCQSFIYGGCRGNLNRYGTPEECMSRCSTDGRFDGRDQTRSSWTAAVFLVGTLVIISVLLLATLIIITLRRHRLPRRSSSVSDKEELLPDEASVDSLSLSENPQPQPKA